MTIVHGQPVCDSVDQIWVDGRIWNTEVFPLHSLRTGCLGQGWVKHWTMNDGMILISEEGKPLLSYRPAAVRVRFSDPVLNRQAICQELFEAEQAYEAARAHQAKLAADKEHPHAATFNMTNVIYAKQRVTQLELELSKL